jgi:hypothetical protein
VQTHLGLLSQKKRTVGDEFWSNSFIGSSSDYGKIFGLKLFDSLQQTAVDKKKLI